MKQLMTFMIAITCVITNAQSVAEARTEKLTTSSSMDGGIYHYYSATDTEITYQIIPPGELPTINDYPSAKERRVFKKLTRQYKTTVEWEADAYHTTNHDRKDYKVFQLNAGYTNALRLAESIGINQRGLEALMEEYRDRRDTGQLWGNWKTQ
ncbi:hypothetical protein KC866_03390 [Patescibacteria group bacterium]|nr:hypothetical protein [Patescibacteria group bacterium]